MKIVCIGRNYLKHAKEMNSEVPKEPIFFLKPDTAICREKVFHYPDFTNDLHYEVELVIKIKKVGKNIDAKFAHKYYNEIGLGIDFTARDIQSICKEKGLPWEKAKGFDNSAIVSKDFVDISSLDLSNINFHLELNDLEVQKGNSSEMIFKIDDLISYISTYMTLKKGDLIFTGTPEGVGPIAINDRLKGFLNNQLMFNIPIK